MRVVASDEARELIAERGGRLFVSVQVARCCGAARTLRAATDVDDPEQYRPVAEEAGLAVFFRRRVTQLPGELHVELGRKRRLEAYWDGCAWIV